MSSATVSQDAPPSVLKICEDIKLGDPARELLDDELTPKAYFDLLAQNGLDDDAIRFIARWMPKREAVWWGCLCAWSVCRPDPSEEVDAALKAAVRWVQDPSEDNRQATRPRRKAPKSRTPARRVALAVFHSSGSISLPDLPEVPPAPATTAKMIAGAVGLAANQGAPSKIADRRRQFLRLGVEVVSGENSWE